MTTPYLFSIGERAEAIVEAFKQRQISTQEALIREINEAEREQAERGISGQPFAIMWLLKEQGISSSDAEKMATEMAKAFKEYLHWQTSDKQNRQIHLKLYQLLDKTSANDVPPVVEKIMSVIRRRQ